MFIVFSFILFLLLIISCFNSFWRISEDKHLWTKAFLKYVNKEFYFMRTVGFLSHCPSTDSPWILSEWRYIECTACVTGFTYKSSTLLPCYSAELFQAESDAQCETIRRTIRTFFFFFSYQLCQLLENSLCFWGSFFFSFKSN